MLDSNVTPTVRAIGQIHMEGNIIPASWYRHIQTKDKKPDFVAISILSDIVYWYRPTEVRNEATGELIGYKKKFAADMLQRSYDQLAAQFGISKEQARDACHRLRDAHLIKIDIRYGVRYGDGMVANNVVYLEPIPEAILEVSYRVTQVGVAKQATPPSDVDTNTETTTEISTTHTQASAPEKDNAPKSERQAAFQEIEQEFPLQLTGGDYQKFNALWDQYPDFRRHQYAIARVRASNPKVFLFYLKDFAGYDPNKPLSQNKPPGTTYRPKSHYRILND